ncbi:DUF362 domain-containing protein [Thermodesulfobacteriota bacterium]
MITINTEECAVCGGCIDLCPEIAIQMVDDTVVIDAEKCIDCKICLKVCPVNAPYESD